LFKKAGINEENIDQIQNRMNSVMEQMGDSNPFEMFKNFLDADPDNELGLMMENFDLSDLGDFNMDALESSDEADLADSDSEQPDESDSNKGASLMAATIDGDSDSGKDNVQKSDPRSRRRRSRRNKFLDQFGTNLTEKAKRGEIDRIVGREEELNRADQYPRRQIVR